jgi:hypothetical protein
VNQDKSFFDRLLEIIAVLLLAVTTLGTAWCGYQASQWSGVQTDDNRIEAEHRLDGNREFGRAIQTISYDTNMVALYAQAVQAGNTGLVQFYRQSLFRPEFLPTLDKWEAQVAAGQAPTPLVQDPEYLDSLRSTYLQAQEQADQAAKDAQQAGDYSQQYVLNTIVLAVALFFAGVTSSFRYQPARALLIVLALATLAFAASRVADLPIA